LDGWPSPRDAVPASRGVFAMMLPRGSAKVGTAAEGQRTKKHSGPSPREVGIGTELDGPASLKRRLHRWGAALNCHLYYLPAGTSIHSPGDEEGRDQKAPRGDRVQSGCFTPALRPIAPFSRTGFVRGCWVTAFGFFRKRLKDLTQHFKFRQRGWLEGRVARTDEGEPKVHYGGRFSEGGRQTRSGQSRQQCVRRWRLKVGGDLSFKRAAQVHSELPGNPSTAEGVSQGQCPDRCSTTSGGEFQPMSTPLSEEVRGTWPADAGHRGAKQGQASLPNHQGNRWRPQDERIQQGWRAEEDGGGWALNRYAKTIGTSQGRGARFVGVDRRLASLAHAGVVEACRRCNSHQRMIDEIRRGRREGLSIPNRERRADDRRTGGLAAPFRFIRRTNPSALGQCAPQGMGVTLDYGGRVRSLQKTRNGPLLLLRQRTDSSAAGRGRGRRRAMPGLLTQPNPPRPGLAAGGPGLCRVHKAIGISSGRLEGPAHGAASSERFKAFGQHRPWRPAIPAMSSRWPQSGQVILLLPSEGVSVVLIRARLRTDDGRGAVPSRAAVASRGSEGMGGDPGPRPWDAGRGDSSATGEVFSTRSRGSRG